MPVSTELAKGLAVKWPEIEKTYIKTLHMIFQTLREERDSFCQYFFHRKYTSFYLMCYAIKPLFMYVGKSSQRICAVQITSKNLSPSGRISTMVWNLIFDARI